MDDNTEEKQNRQPCCSKLDMGRGCEFCDCCSEKSAKACDGCFKLHATDWLADYPNNFADDIVEVRFKNTRRSYYQNTNDIPIEVGDIVAVEASPGHDIGIVSLTGDMVGRQMRRIGFNPHNGEFKKIYRKAKPNDIEKWQEAIALEHNTMIRARQIAADMNMNMKIGDVEYQGDKIKAIFYYIADDRVDFRELIKVFADQFRIRIEMKQIGARQEAGRIGGLGSCGRELCCSSWMSSFTSVTTNAARMQDISLNPQKLAGQCSKLKCCMMYEYDDYMDALKDFPKVTEPLRILDGDYFFVKNDILARLMSFSTSPNSMEGLVWISTERVRDIQKLNRKGIKPDSIEDDSKPKKETPKGDFIDLLGEESITRFDTSSKRKRNGKKGKPTNDKNTRQTSSDKAGDQAENPGGRNGFKANQQRDSATTDRRDGAKPTQRKKQNERSGGKHISGKDGAPTINTDNVPKSDSGSVGTAQGKRAINPKPDNSSRQAPVDKNRKDRNVQANRPENKPASGLKDNDTKTESENQSRNRSRPHPKRSRRSDDKNTPDDNK